MPLNMRQRELAAARKPLLGSSIANAKEWATEPVASKIHRLNDAVGSGLPVLCAILFSVILAACASRAQAQAAQKADVQASMAARQRSLHWRQVYARRLHINPAVVDAARQPQRQRPWLGVVLDAAPLPARRDRMPAATRYVRLTGILEGSPASRAGLMKGDFILELAGEGMAQGDDAVARFVEAIRRQQVGAEVALVIMRDGRRRVVDVRLGSWPRHPMTEARHPALEIDGNAPMSSLAKELGSGERLRHYARASGFVSEVANRLSDIEWAGNEPKNPFRLPEVTYLLRKPLTTPAVAAELIDRLVPGAGGGGRQPPNVAPPSSATALSTQLREAALILNLDMAEAMRDRHADDKVGLTALVRRWQMALQEVNQAFLALGGEERRFLWRTLVERSEEELEADAWTRLLELTIAVDRARLAAAAMKLAALFDSHRRAQWPAALAGWEHLDEVAAPAGISGPVLFSEETPFGLVVVGGAGANVYRRDAAIIVDLGGDDVYLNNAGASRPAIPVAVVFDLSGNDVYEQATQPAQGSGCLGVGMLIDAAGNDAYRAHRLAQGVGCLGVGLLLDAQGDDTYQGDRFLQGFALFGIGMLVDDSGWDCYRAAGYAQGASMVGGFGALIETGGNDLYYAGGKYPDFRDPRNATTSYSQGFSIGVRPADGRRGVSGGVGLLADFAGDDVYRADYFAQGSSYWYGLGILYDGDGNDQYLAGRYAQGAGIHLSVGALLDEAGNDLYEASFGVSQGIGHDRGVGVLADAAGNDRYTAGRLAQGAGNANSVGLLLDVDGSDHYASKMHGAAWGNAPADGASYGILMDLGAGSDRFPNGLEGGQVLERARYGLFIDRK